MFILFKKKKNYQKDIVFFFHFAMDNVFSTKKSAENLNRGRGGNKKKSCFLIIQI